MTPLAYLATFSGIFMGSSNLFQAYKIFKTKSAHDIAVTGFLLVEVGSFIWILYGYELKSIPVLVPNLLGFIATSLVLLGYYLYGRKKKTRLP